MTKLYISSDTWDIYTDKTNHFSGFNEYGMKYDKIISSSISNKISDSNIYFENILLIPFTHINNIWHLMHHVYLTYKYIRKNKITTKIVYPVFFDSFYKKQGDIEKCPFNDVIFKGLGLDYQEFKKINKIFKENQFVTIDNIFFVNEQVHFFSEPLFNHFKINVINNFGLKYKLNEKKNITFILRKGTREITNIDDVKKNLIDFQINYVYLENHSIKEQIEIFNKADIVIGVHGAGLSWCVFMKNKSLLIEMYPGNSNTDNYIRWCKIASVNYYRLPVNITDGNEEDFRNATIHLNDFHISKIKNKISNYL